MASKLYGAHRNVHLTKEEETLHKIFDIYSVTPGDFSRPMKFMNIPLFTKFLEDLSKFSSVLCDLDKELVNAFFALIDRDCDGKISFHEFTGWWRSEFSPRTKYHPLEPDVRLKLRMAWRLFQRFCVGKCIPFHRFEYMMEYLKVHYADTDFDIIDTNADGKLSFAEFSDWLKWY